MKLTIPPIKIEEDEGFSPDKDIFSRKEFGERLATLVAQSKGELVLAIDAQWGEGKSTFIKMWKGYIYHHHKPKIRSIYFDAFENDYQKDPFLALVAEIYELLKDESEPKKKEFRKKAGNAVKSMLRGGMKIGVSNVTGGLLGGSEMDAVEEGISKLFSKNVDTLIDDRLESSAKDKLALRSFRDHLKDFALAHGEDTPIVFIIDELDRCRPDFALEIVEQVKHLFSVPGITFLLVLNRKQMEESIKLRYGGDGVNATTYLQKFVNLWLTLPRKSDSHDDHGAKYVMHVLDSMLDEGEQIVNQEAVHLLKELVKYLRPSYRKIERMLSYFAVIHNNIDDKIQELYLKYQLLISFICYIKSSKPNIIDRIVNNEISSKILIEETGLKDIDNNGDYSYIYTLTRHVIYDLANDEQKKKMMEAEAESFVVGFGRDPKGVMVTVCSWLIDIDRIK